MDRLSKYVDHKGVEIRGVEDYSKLELFVHLRLEEEVLENEEDALEERINFVKEISEDPKYKACMLNEKSLKIIVSERTNLMKQQQKIFSQIEECEMDKKQYEKISEKTDQKNLGEMIEKYRRRRSSSVYKAEYKRRIEKYKERDRGYQGPYKKKYFNREDKKYYNDREFKDRSRSRDRANVGDIKKKEEELVDKAEDNKNKEDKKKESEVDDRKEVPEEIEDKREEKEYDKKKGEEYVKEIKEEKLDSIENDEKEILENSREELLEKEKEEEFIDEAKEKKEEKEQVIEKECVEEDKEKEMNDVKEGETEENVKKEEIKEEKLDLSLIHISEPTRLLSIG